MKKRMVWSILSLTVCSTVFVACQKDAKQNLLPHAAAQREGDINGTCSKHKKSVFISSEHITNRMDSNLARIATIFHEFMNVPVLRMNVWKWLINAIFEEKK